MTFSRREFVKIMGAAAAAGMLPACNKSGSKSTKKELYDLPIEGQVRILHITDTHAQLKPIFFREPNVNLGTGPARGRLPHIVGKNLINKLGISDPKQINAFTYLDFEAASEKYGKVGGYAHIKTLVDSLREQAGGKKNTITLDGGDTWHGSATALWTRGMDMVEAGNLIGFDYMTGHWEFTYTEEEVLKNISKFKGEFLAQNIRIKEDSLFGDSYLNLASKYNGIGLFSEEESLPFKPYSIKEINGYKVAVIGQAFPRTSNANPTANFPDWSFGLREAELQKVVDKIKSKEKPHAIIMLSHNGMDVDIKMGSRVNGINLICGGHTHDGVPNAIKVKDPNGNICHITNGGSNGKYVGVADLKFSDNKLKNINYKLLPVFSKMIKADAKVNKFIDNSYARKYDKNIIESRNSKRYYNKERLGKTYKEILDEELATTDTTLYRRGNFIGTYDQLIVDALRTENDTQIAFSAGVRWGTSVLAGQTITMERLMDQTSLTYGETYKSNITGQQIKNTLEGICENLFQKDPYLQSGGDMVRVGGMDYTCEPNASFGKRISNMKLDNGKAIESGKTYTLSGWAQVEQIGSGKLIWDTVKDYLKDNKHLTFKKVNYPTLKGVKTNPGIADYGGKLI